MNNLVEAYLKSHPRELPELFFCDTPLPTQPGHPFMGTSILTHMHVMAFVSDGVQLVSLSQSVQLVSLQHIQLVLSLWCVQLALSQRVQLVSLSLCVQLAQCIQLASSSQHVQLLLIFFSVYTLRYLVVIFDYCNPGRPEASPL